MSHRRFPALTLIAAGVLALTTVCIPAATADDIDDLCCKTSLLIRGRAGT